LAAGAEAAAERVAANATTTHDKTHGTSSSTSSPASGSKGPSNGGPELSSAEDPFAHLPENQADILRRQAHVPNDSKKGGVAALYRYTSRIDLLIMIVCGICSAASGAALPSMTIIFGGLQGVFQDYFNNQTSFSHFQSEMTRFVLYFVYLGVGQFVVTYIATLGYIYVGEHITAKIRREYLRSCLRQVRRYRHSYRQRTKDSSSH
jgi:ATP-binding cassette subfamily B (MDR/TAP) protein 1